MKKRKVWIRIIELLILLAVAVTVSASVGSSSLNPLDAFRIIAAKLPGIGNFFDISNLDDSYVTIIWNVRLPRICLSALTGAALSLAGCTYQGVFRNPLADPYILGVSSGAALCATIATVCGLSVSFAGLGPVGLAAFAGAVFTVFLVFGISKTGGGISMTGMLLTGTAVSTMFSALISLLLTFNHEQLARIYMWTMGSFTSATWDKNLLLVIFVALAGCALILLAPKLNLLMMGEDDAKSLGLDTGRYRMIFIVIASLLVAAAVSVSGIIGFVGPIIPHSVRMIEGSDNRRVMPVALLGGAVFMLVCDTIARTAVAPTEIPIGIITAVFGAPYFIILLITGKKRTSRGGSF